MTGLGHEGAREGGGEGGGKGKVKFSSLKLNYSVFNTFVSEYFL